MALDIYGKTDATEIVRKRTETASLLDYASSSRDAGAFNDVTVKVGKVSVHANKMVLSCYSQYFEKMFKTNQKKKGKNVVEVDSVDEESLRSLIEFIYTGSITINSKNICNLIVAASHLQIETVKPFLFDFLEGAISSNCCSIILTIAELYNAPALKERAVQFLCENFNGITNSREFKNYTLDELKSFICNQDRNQIPETSVYKALIKWTLLDYITRSNYFSELFVLVDLNKIPFTFLEKEVAREKLVIENHDCSKLLIKAFSKQTSELQVKDSRNVSKILSLGGRGSMSKVVEVINLSREEKKSYYDLPSGRCGGCAVAMHGYIYFLGGLGPDHKCNKTVWRLSLLGNCLPWEEIAPMIHSRHIMGGAVLHNTLVVVGGWDKHGSLGSAEYYSEILNTWNLIHPMTELRSGHSLVVCKGSLFAIGGFVHDGKYLSSVEQLQAVQGEWKQVAPMTMPRFCFAAMQYGEFIYAIGGQAGKEATTRQKSVEKYDIVNNFWVIIEEMNFKRSGCHASVLDGKIYVVGGVDTENEVVREIECYDPDVNKWRITGKTTENFSDHALVAV